MSMFRTMNSSLIISIGISILLCGAIVYYCNSRLNNVEMAIMRQNQVLTSFIANVQNELKGGGGSCLRPPTEDLSTEVARASAERQDNKIVVSDDDDDDDSSSESDTEDEDEDNNDNDNDNDNEHKITIADNNNNDDSNLNIKEINLSDILTVHNNNTHTIKIVDIQDLSMFMSEVNLENLTVSNPSQSIIYEIKDDSSESDDDDSDGEVEGEGEVEIEEKKIYIKKEIKKEPVNNADILSNLDNTLVQAPLKHEQMRVDDLRKLVVDNNLSTKDEVKKLKKPELLALLNNL